MSDKASTQTLPDAESLSRDAHGVKHIVALSGGKDSAALALRLAEVEPREYEYICTPTGNELPEMLLHWKRLGELLGRPLTPVSSGKSLGGLIRRWNALPNWRMRWCTRVLKIEPFEAYVLTHRPATVYVGIRADEATREGVDYDALDGVRRRYPLVEWGWDLASVRGYLRECGVAIPQRTDCAACFYQTLGEWYRLYLEHPDLYAEAEAWEKTTGHTFRSPQRDTWPAALTELRREFESGRIPRGRKEAGPRTTMCSVCAR